MTHTAPNPIGTLSGRPLIFVVGPFPPPVHGLSIITQCVAQMLGDQTTVRRFDVTGSSAASPTMVHRLQRTWALARLWLQLRRALVREQPAALFIGGSAGTVMLFDALVARLAALAGVPVHVHHHSFACLEAPSLRWNHRIALALMRKCRHVVLCVHMGRLLASRHRIAQSQITVLSNAAFVPVPQPCPAQRRGDNAELRLGFLANITRSKGIFEFFEVAERLHAAEHQVRALIAGPLDRAIQRQFTERLAQCSFAVHLGALDEVAKADFFSRIDVLVLPSKYVHEAEPLVMIEALAHGVPVLATRRGCVATAWGDERAVHVLDEAEFAEQACAVLAPWMSSAALRHDWAVAAKESHACKRIEALAQWEGLAATLRGRSA